MYELESIKKWVQYEIDRICDSCDPESDHVSGQLRAYCEVKLKIAHFEKGAIFDGKWEGMKED